jgi:nitrate reductase NapE component
MYSTLAICIKCKEGMLHLIEKTNHMQNEEIISFLALYYVLWHVIA